MLSYTFVVYLDDLNTHIHLKLYTDALALALAHTHTHTLSMPFSVSPRASSKDSIAT